MTRRLSAVQPPEGANTRSGGSDSLAMQEGEGAMTLAQKLIARAAGRASVAVGDIVTCQVDLAMFHDSSGPRRLKPMLEQLGAQIWDKSRVVLVMDHYVPEQDDESRRIVRIARDWAAEQRLPHVYDTQGICHVVVPQHGHIRPGMFCVGGDSHSATGGAFGAYMFGIGATEMLGVMVTGEIWLRVPQTIRMQWDGQLPRGVCAKDMMLHMISRFGMNGGRYQAVEYCGETVVALSMNERMTLCNMSAELGAQTGLVAPDAVTARWLDEQIERSAFSRQKRPLAHAGNARAAIDLIASVPDYSRWTSEAAAIEGPDCITYHFDAAALAPQVAAPHSPANTDAVTTHVGTPIDIAYIGACTGAKLDDLRAAAQVLQGRRVAAGVRLMLAPASLQDQEAARHEGLLQTLLQAGAELLPTTCGACAGYGNTLEGDVTVISSTARNFKGRMGSTGAQVYLASPATVAASALNGHISDPREVLA